MLRSWKIGRMFGVDIFLHWTFWILPILVIVGTKAFTPLTAALALLFVAAACVIIVMHEFGHILTARVFGIGTRDVILTPLGGMARMERMSEKPHEEILIALAGPAVNLVLAFAFGILAFSVIGVTGLQEMSHAERHPFGGWQELLMAICGANVVMGLFNMLPAFPMDGGRVFRGILAAMMDRLTATTIAVWVGTFVIAAAGLIFFFGAHSILAPPLAVFIALLGHMELAMVKRKEAFRQHMAYEQRMRVEPEEVIVPGLPPEPGFSGYTWNARASAWIEWRDGNPVRACRIRAG